MKCRFSLGVHYLRFHLFACICHGYILFKFCMQEDADVGEESKTLLLPQPIALVRGELKTPEMLLFLLSQSLCRAPLENLPYILLCSFYAFNVQYSNGCTNFYSFLEYIFLNLLKEVNYNTLSPLLRTWTELSFAA